jgi:chromosome segregation ATPase
VSEQEQAGSREDGDQAQLDSLREKVAARGEEALGRIAQDLLENPWINSALAAAFEARGKASQAQEVAMDFLNLPSAAQIERLTRRVRSVSQRLEAIEDALSRLEDSLEGTPVGIATRLDAIERQLADAKRLLAALATAQPQPASEVSPGQERLRVEEPAGPSAH